MASKPPHDNRSNVTRVANEFLDTLQGADI
jgi:hypothetical protein